MIDVMGAMEPESAVCSGGNMASGSIAGSAQACARDSPPAAEAAAGAGAVGKSLAVAGMAAWPDSAAAGEDEAEAEAEREASEVDAAVYAVIARQAVAGAVCT